MTHRLMDNFTCPCKHRINNVAVGYDFVLLTAVIMKYNTHENMNKLITQLYRIFNEQTRGKIAWNAEKLE
jgi:hypothetical protein